MLPKIKNLEFGNTCKVIAELGTLHHHNPDGLMAATRQCFDAGADMVKVQFIRPQYAWWAHPKAKMRYYELDETFGPRHWADYLNDANMRNAGPVFGSIFDSITLHELMDHLPVVKLAFKVNMMPELWMRLSEEILPCIMSTNDTIPDNAYWPLKRTDRWLFQYVQPSYPLDVAKVRLPLFGRYSSLYEGLSYHGKDMRVVAGAVALGAKTVEMHVKGEDAQGHDMDFALTMKELEVMVTMIRKQEARGL